MYSLYRGKKGELAIKPRPLDLRRLPQRLEVVRTGDTIANRVTMSNSYTKHPARRLTAPDGRDTVRGAHEY